MLPWTIFSRLKKIPEIEKEWNSLIEAPNTEAVFRNGLWHVPEYQGFVRERSVAHSQAIQTSRSATIESSAQLADLETGGNRLLNQFRDSMHRTQTGSAEGGPATSAQMSDQPAHHTSPNVISHQVHREALCGESGCGKRVRPGRAVDARRSKSLCSGRQGSASATVACDAYI